MLAPNSLANDAKVVGAQHTTVAAEDTISTGLKNVVAAGATLNSDPVDNPLLVSVSIGSNGQITIKTWQNTTGTDPTPAAATTFGKLVSWWAIGD